ncbi:hypothetical protein BEP19_06545 [Ammoniphilus oxalaticus]|uniref:4Fe-4S ferredoxin-type domain-containing protein n=1 Tax=Ammoniphilus oxalaticus TaxID=66863 RepID=A0A419SJ75_9BACL|nr:4Fe-4S binding protein [Ammoniphilus oxalaticus]RKD24063.1 hypothetical protein BEP19_06545 [Ammoniphilus oxalaticus]
MKISRPIAQVSFFLLFFFVPLLNIFRVDLTDLKFYLFATTFRFSEGYILLIIILFIVFLFVGISKWFGRQFCGWMCPHNTFSVYLYKLTQSKMMKNKPLLSRTIDFSLPIFLAPLIAFSALAYLFDPFNLAEQIFTLRWNNWTVGVFLLLSCVFFLMIFRLRSRFCRHACPYGIFQMTFADKHSNLRGIKNMFQGTGLVLFLILSSLVGLLGFSLYSTNSYSAIIEKQIQGVPAGEFSTYTYILNVRNNAKETLNCEIDYEGIPASWEVSLPEQIEVDGMMAHEETILLRIDQASMNQHHNILITLKNSDGSIIEKKLNIFPVQQKKG